MLVPALLDFRSLQHQIQPRAELCPKAEIKFLELQGKELSQAQVCRRSASRAQEAENSEVNPGKHLITFIHLDESSAGYLADAAAKKSFPLQ